MTTTEARPAQVGLDRWNRYLIPRATDGRVAPHVRVTTVAETLEDHYRLGLYHQRMVAVGLAVRSDLYARVAAARPDDKRALDRYCEEAREAAGASARANQGSALHEFTARLDLGEELVVPPPWDADVTAYTTTMGAAGVTVEADMVERLCVLGALEVAGTLDRLVSVGGRRYVGDLKTGSTLEFSWGAIAVQLALYAHAESLFDAATGTHSPMPEVDRERALVVHLPAGSARCELHWIDIAAGWEAVEHALWARAWRRRKDLSVPFERAAPLAAERRAFLIERITDLAAGHPRVLELLAARWPAGVPTFRQVHAHSDGELDLVALALSSVEAELQAPFGPTDPAEEPVGVQERLDLTTRLGALPEDLGHALPGVPTTVAGFTRRVVGELEPHLAEAETTAAVRAGEVAAITAGISSDDELVAVFLRTAGVEGPATSSQLDALRALGGAMERQVVHFDQDERGHWVLAVDAEVATKALVDLCGTRQAALAYVKEVARNLGLPVPRSLSRALEDVLAVAYATMLSKEPD